MTYCLAMTFERESVPIIVEPVRLPEPAREPVRREEPREEKPATPRPRETDPAPA